MYNLYDQIKYPGSGYFLDNKPDFQRNSNFILLHVPGNGGWRFFNGVRVGLFAPGRFEDFGGGMTTGVSSRM